jgi:hypothetical protein
MILNGVVSMLKERLKFIKENLSIIAIVPLILGGFWQVASLASMSPAYIRFFSVTQQIADGLVILFTLTILFILFSVFAYLSRIQGSSRFEDFVSLGYSQLITKLFISCFMVVGTCFSFYWANILSPLTAWGTDAAFWDYMGIIGMIYFLVLVVVQFLRILSALVVKFYGRDLLTNRANKVFKYAQFPLMILTTMFGMGIIFLIIFGSVEILVGFHNMFRTPANLKNERLMLEKYMLKSKALNRDSVRILYMNDRYIFIKDSSKVAVVKFELLFE